jgi:hypothetical protein
MPNLFNLTPLYCPLTSETGLSKLATKFCCMVAIALVFGIDSAHSATVTQTGDMAYGTTWTQASYWSDNLAAHAGADYVNGNILRTPANSSAQTFPGDSLTLQNGGLFSYKGTASQIVTVNNLTLDNSTLQNVAGVGNDMFTLQGSFLDVRGTTSQLLVNPVYAGMGIIVNCTLLSGNGNLGMVADPSTLSSATVTLNPVTSSFSGNLYLGTVGGYTSASNIYLTIKDGFSTIGSLNIGTNGVYNISGTQTFGEVIIDGSVLPAGTYNYSDLSARGFASYFTNGSGNLISTTTNHVLFSDNFSDNEVTTPTYSLGSHSWVIDSGAFRADGVDVPNHLETAGQLNFGTASLTAIHLDLAPPSSATTETVEFDLRQSDGAQGGNHVFTLQLWDSANAATYYALKMSLNPAYFGTTSGFCCYTNTTLTTVGTAGMGLLNGGFRTVKLSFNPKNKTFTLTYDGVTALTGTLPALKVINRIVLINETGTVSWFVDNVIVRSIFPKPSGAIIRFQ